MIAKQPSCFGDGDGSGSGYLLHRDSNIQYFFFVVDDDCVVIMYCCCCWCGAVVVVVLRKSLAHLRLFRGEYSPLIVSHCDFVEHVVLAYYASCLLWI